MELGEEGDFKAMSNLPLLVETIETGLSGRSEEKRFTANERKYTQMFRLCACGVLEQP